MKASITNLLFLNALELASHAEKARASGMVQTEIRSSIGTHLMAALALEGAVNEVAETVLGPWVWDRLEKVDTPLKWWIVLGLFSKESLDPGREPIQTIHQLHKLRNRIAHPKLLEQGSDIILRHSDGRIERDVPAEKVLQGGETLYMGYGELLDELNAESARRAIDRTKAALCYLNDRAKYPGLDWLNAPGD